MEQAEEYVGDGSATDALEIPPDVRDDLRWLHSVVEAGHAREFNSVAFAASDAEDTIMRTVLQMMRLPLDEWVYDFERECLVCRSDLLSSLAIWTGAASRECFDVA